MHKLTLKITTVVKRKRHNVIVNHRTENNWKQQDMKVIVDIMKLCRAEQQETDDSGMSAMGESAQNFGSEQVIG